MNIYTKTGDKGQTSLANGKRISKTDCRLEAYGTADELNSFVGNLRAAVQDSEIDQQLSYIQNRLFDLGAILAGAEMTMPDECISLIEKQIDDIQASLPPLRVFILPAGSEAITRCHICRTITRRLERQMLRIEDQSYPSEQIFVNRLSDYFFVLARHIGEKEGIEPVGWKK